MSKDVSITDLIARMRHDFEPSNLFANASLEVVMSTAADALENNQNTLNYDRDYIKRLEAKISALEAVTVPTETDVWESKPDGRIGMTDSAKAKWAAIQAVPTENDEWPLKAALDALDREENWSRDPDSNGWVYDIQGGARSIIARGFRLPVPVEPEWEYGFSADGGMVVDRAFGIIPFETAEAAEHTGSKWFERTLDIVRRTKGVPAGEWQPVASDELEGTS